MTEEQRAALASTLDFPPTGSVEYKAMQDSDAAKDKSLGGCIFEH
jgi:hypothetical protein